MSDPESQLVSQLVRRGRDDAAVALLRTPPTLDVAPNIGELVVVAGPDAGGRFPVALGRSVIGRAASCEITIRDADIEPHHVLVDVDVSGIVRLTQLTGRQPILVDGRSTATATLANTGAHLELGSTRIEWRAHSSARGRLAINEQPVLGYVDAGDRAFGIDAASPNRLPGHMVSLPITTRQLCIVGSDIGHVVRSIVGQCAQSGWAVQSSFAGAACSIDSGSRSLVVINRADQSPSTDRLDRLDRLDRDVADIDDVHCVAGGEVADGVDLVVRTIDGVVDGDEVDHSEFGSTGSAIIVGERCRGRYIPDINEFATTRLHLVGWHAATFAGAAGL